MLAALRQEEARKSQEVAQTRPSVEKLRGEKEYLENEAKRMKEKFQAENKADEFSVYQTLFKLDPAKYAETMKDFSGQPDAYPVWANMDFLERGAEIGPSDTKQLKAEIMRLRLENKDFAAELEKAQNLLQLQRDIELDNGKYFDAETQRLLLTARAASLKAEELARRADEKQRQINDVSRKLGGSLSPAKSVELGGRGLDDVEVQSEFSAATNESEVRTEENVLDLVLQDAEFYFDAFRQVLDERELLLHQKTLITFVSVDFFNHDTETS